jgi:tetratricopeptide (TPR) repeat protein
LIDLEMYTEARTQLEAALRVEPGNDRAHELMRRIEEAEARARKIADAISRVERLIEDDRLDEAVGQAQTAIGQVGDATELLAVMERVERLIRERRDAQVSQLLDAAVEAQDQGRPDDAVRELERASELDPDRQTVTSRLDAARALAARAHEVEQAIDSVDAMIAAGRLDDAAGELAAAVDRLGDDPRFQTARTRLGELSRAQATSAVREAITRGQRMLEDGHLEAASEAFAAALEISPDDPSALEGAWQAEAMRSAGEAVAEIEAALAASDVERATAILDQAVRRVGVIGELPRMLELLEQARVSAERAEAPVEATIRIDVQRELAEAEPDEPPTQPVPMIAPTPEPERPAPPRVTTPARPKAAPKPGINPKVLIGLAAAAVVAIVVVVILIVTGREPTPPIGEPGRLVVAAVPWGEVVAITGASGEIELPDDRTTPFVVELPAGDYTIQLRGPDGGDSVELAASVEAGGVERSASTFQTVEAEALLERYGL